MSQRDIAQTQPPHWGGERELKLLAWLIPFIIQTILPKSTSRSLLIYFDLKNATAQAGGDQPSGGAPSGHNGNGFSFDSCIGHSTKDCPSWTPTSDSANADVGTSPDDFSDVKAPQSSRPFCKLENFPFKNATFWVKVV